VRDVLKSARIFLQSSFLAYKGLFRWLHPLTYLASKVIMPV